MAEQKWAKNIITTRLPHMPKIVPGFPDLHHILGVNGKILPGSFCVNCCWMFAHEKPGYMAAHSHDYDEIIGFIGTNPDDTEDMGAVAEYWMEDEKYMITKTCMIYIPKHVKHCPLTVTNIKRPVFHFDIQLTEEVHKLDYSVKLEEA